MRQIAKISLFIYKRDLKEILLIIILGIVIWIVVGVLLSKKTWTARIWRIINHIVFVLILIAILYLTLFSRSMTNEQEVCLIPFYSFYLAKENSELYRTMLMNLFLFVPLGLSLPNAFAGRKYRVQGSILAILIISVVIEVLQFVFKLGCVEVDDVLCNTLGGLLGIGTYILTTIILAAMKLKDKKGV